MKSPSLSESFSIAHYKFDKDTIGNIEYNIWAKSLWPLVYILSDDLLKEAYIGESTNAVSRMLNHLSNPERKRLNNLHLITSSKFNKSATLDIESNLIKYISGDGQYKLQNGNAGLVFHNYYQKDEYFQLFTEIWSKLKADKIAVKNLSEIDNSDLFKYSPYKSLTPDQYNSVKEIIDFLIRDRTKSLFVSGSAGTGKTVLAIFLIKLLVTELKNLFDTDENETEEGANVIKALKNKFPNPKVALVIPMTSLRNTLKTVFKNIKGLSPKMVIGPSEVIKKEYDILLVDEAHRLRQRKNITNYKSFDDANKVLKLGKNGTELDWILARSKHQIFFYDSRQSIKPSDVVKSEFDLLFKKSAQLSLRSQLRVKGGQDYISFIEDLLETSLPKKSSLFASNTYELTLFDSLENLVQELNKKECELGLCRLIAGYSWKWKSKRGGNAHDIEIDGLKLKWNSKFQEWINSKGSINEVGCIHTTQGYDLNYAGVIFGEDISYDPKTDQIYIIEDNYYDSKGKIGIKDPDELKAYIVNIYRTLMYRGIYGTFVYVCDKNLKAYFKKHIQTSTRELPFKILTPNEAKPFINCVPLYDISVAAGGFTDIHKASDFEWIELPGSYKPNRDFFVCKVFGESMNKKIPNGSWCLFKKDPGGSREGKIVLVEHYDIQDSDFGAGFTIKLYHSEKVITEDNWSHESIHLKPFSTNSNYKEIVFSDKESLDQLKVVGAFIAVLG